MRLVYSNHWLRKKRYRQDITDDLIEYAIQNSDRLRDKHWPDVFNAVCKIPQNGRRLKVVYKIIDNNVCKVLTAFWID